MEERNEVSILALVSEVAISCIKSLISRHVTEVYLHKGVNIGIKWNLIKSLLHAPP